MKIGGMEPAAWIGAAISIVALLVAFGVPITSEQGDRLKDALTALLPLMAALLIRREVLPTAKVEAAHGEIGVMQAANVTSEDLAAVKAEKAALDAVNKP